MTIFVGMRELSNNTKNVIAKLKEGNSIILTDNGKPRAAMVGITENYNFEEVYKMIKQYELDLMFREMHRQAKRNKVDNMSMDEIDRIVQSARKEMKRKK